MFEFFRSTVQIIVPIFVISTMLNVGLTQKLSDITGHFPIQAAVGFGVVLSALLYVNESSTDISLVELIKQPDERIKERKLPKQLPSNEVTVLDVYGHLFYAGARTLERLLPTPRGAQKPVVILRLRGRTTLGATLVEVLTNYAAKLQDVDGRLYLTGISERAYEQVVRTGKLRLTGSVRAYEATPIRGQSTTQAHSDAQIWLVEKRTDSSLDESVSDDASTKEHYNP